MATADDGTYIYIPPPPLPEFYMSGANDDAAARLSTFKSSKKCPTSKIPLTALDGVYDGLSTTFGGYPPPMMAIPLQPGNQVPPLAIYHICRVCLRTRSARYHREHPIPVDGLPPPPGICRRCRVTSVESVEEIQKVSEVVFEGESNEVKLGFITPFVPDDAIVSSEDMKQMRADEWMEHINGQRKKERSSSHVKGSQKNDIVYRYVDVVDDERYEAPTKKRTKVAFFSETKSADESDQEPAQARSKGSNKATTSMQVQPSEKQSLKSERTSKSKKLHVSDGQAVSKSSFTSSSRSSSQSTVKASGQVVLPSPPVPTDATIREIARDEVERYHRERLCDEQRLNLVREIARDEVERYRQAERIIAAHSDPYAHGKMVPENKQIEQKRDVTDKPWLETEKKEKISITSNRPGKCFSAYQSEDDFPKPTSRPKKQERTTPKASRSPQPGQQRELSIDRQEIRSSSRRTESIGQFRPAPQRQDESTTSRHADSVSTAAQVGVEKKARSSSSRERSRSEPSIARVGRYEPNRLHDIIEVVEEWEAPADLIRNQTPTPSLQHQNSRPIPILGSDSGAKVVDNRVHSREHTPAEPPRSTSSQRPSRSSRSHNDREWQSSPRVRTLNSGSSGFQEGLENGGRLQSSAHESARPSQRSSRQPTRDFESERRTDISDDKTIWPAAEETSRKSFSQASQQKRSPYEPDPNVRYRIVRPTDAVEDQPLRSRPSKSRSSRDDDREYVYTERIIKPIDCQNEELLFHNRQPRRFEVEEWVATRRHPASDRQTSRRHLKDDRRRMDKHVRDRQEEWDQDDRAYGTDKVRNERPKSYSNPPSPQRSRASARQRNGDDSNRVRFSDKVDYSPTPPDSDDNSSAFRSYHSIGRRSVGGIVDGASSPTQGTKQVAEVEMRGRTRSRASEREDGLSRQQDSRCGNGVSVTAESKKAKEDHRPLDRALSESPSRERSISYVTEDEEYDGGGPYRALEKPSDSMQVEDGRASRQSEYA